MKLIEVAFKLNETLPEWQNALLLNYVPLHVTTADDGPSNYVWIVFRVPDHFEVPE